VSTLDVIQGGSKISLRIDLFFIPVFAG
jgi:hypothetical protein